MSSSLDKLKPIISLLPEISPPTSFPSVKERIFWTIFALLMFFIMYHIPAIGVDPRVFSTVSFLQLITASKIGTLLTTGIGPIILASIFMQLLVGAKIIQLNLSDPAQRATFHGAQKLLAFILAFFEAFVFSTYLSSAGYVLNIFGPSTFWLVVFQIALGSIILLYLDEILSKYGLGSGISLFIAAGVAFSIVGGILNIFFGYSGIIQILSEGGALVFAKIFESLLPLFATLLILLIVVYFEGIKVEVPISYGFGSSSAIPLKFFYLSNIPVILAVAFLANTQLFAMLLLDQNLCLGGTLNLDVPNKAYACEGGLDLINIIGRAERQGHSARFVDGFFYLISPIHHNPEQSYFAQINSYFTYSSPIFNIPEWVHIIVYLLFLVLLCIVFGFLWVDLTGMGPQDVAKQIDSMGFQIPGYRRDVRILSSVLEKYIPPLILIGSVSVGLLAGFADLLGALGTGTGILLTVSIISNFYQSIERYNILGQSSFLYDFLKKR
ncbi:MAG: preprotein translocase subunit SecY [Candidatus Micrarchaeota archaeon]|nr:preprotein translocase subunit SecY [Candidatus Micrarchaeota archaeon]